jgi:type IV secretory pathway VirJ component
MATWRSRLIGWTSITIAAITAIFVGTGYIGNAPLTEYPAASAGERPTTAAVFLSGDMGFIGMGGDLVRRLRADGVPVVAVNSLTFFRTRRTPAEVEGLLATAMRKALIMDGGAPVSLIGQSFGADMLHVGLVSLPADLRAKVHAVVLIVPTDNVHFRASPSAIFSQNNPDADAFATASRLTWVRTLCIYGSLETTSLCPHLKQSNVEAYALPGGHMLNFRTAAVHALLKQANSTGPVA